MEIPKRFVVGQAASSKPSVNASQAVEPRVRYMLEACCDGDSMLGKVAGEFGCVLNRVTKKEDLMSDQGFADAGRFAHDHPGADLWGSLPCTQWSSWQHINKSKGSRGRRQAFAKKLADDRAFSLELVKRYLVLALIVQRNGGICAFEWPTNCTGWAQEVVQDMLDQLQLQPVSFHGCAAGLVATGPGPGGKKVGLGPIFKPWTVYTDCFELSSALGKLQCDRSHAHVHAQGQHTVGTGSYPEKMCRIIHRALSLHFSRRGSKSVVSAPCVGVASPGAGEEVHPAHKGRCFRSGTGLV